MTNLSLFDLFAEPGAEVSSAPPEVPVEAPAPVLTDEKRLAEARTDYERILGRTGNNVALPKEELARVLAFCCPERLAFKKPVKLCQIQGRDYLVVSRMDVAGAELFLAWAYEV